MNINTILQSKMSPKAFHEDMHVAIWSWIREWCEVDHHPELSGLPQSPGDVLRWLIFKIGDCGQDSICPFVVEGGEDQWRGSHMFKFAEKMCEVGQRLDDEDLQDRLLWRTMKEILEFYLHESTTYITNINSLGMNANEINRFFELGLDFFNLRVFAYTVEEFRNQIIWSRYISSRKAWKFNTVTGRFDTTCEASPALWAFWVRDHLDDLLVNMLDGMIREGPTAQVVALEKEEQEKKNTALRKIQETLDEVKEDLDDSLFLQMMNLMKDNYVVSP
jgi:hypothetical protein